MILAIDCSTQWLGIALANEHFLYYEKIWRTARRHTAELAPAIQQALVESNIKISDLQGIAAATGPGSFTSLRIGIAIAKGMALSLSIPIWGIPSLDITAAGVAPSENPLICVLESGRGKLAACLYLFIDSLWKAQGEAYLTTAKELESTLTRPTLIAGELGGEDRHILARRWRNALIAKPALCARRPSLLAELAWQRFSKGQVDDPAMLVPQYLRTIDNISA